MAPATSDDRTEPQRQPSSDPPTEIGALALAVAAPVDLAVVEDAKETA